MIQITCAYCAKVFEVEAKKAVVLHGALVACTRCDQNNVLYIKTDEDKWTMKT